jgi:transposase
MVERVGLTRQISLDELKGQCRGEKDSKIKEASNIAKRGILSIERWVKEWKESGYECLILRQCERYRPRRADGKTQWLGVVLARAGCNGSIEGRN